MARKSADAPRRIYTRKGTAFVNFNGKFFGIPTEKSSLDITKDVRCVPAPNDGGRARVFVTQGRGKRKEAWTSCKISD